VAKKERTQQGGDQMAAVRERQKQRQTGSIVPQFSRDVEGCAGKNFHFALYKGGKDEGKEAACRKRTRIDYLARCAQTRDDLSISELLSFCHRSTKKRGAYSLSCEKSIATVSESKGCRQTYFSSSSNTDFPRHKFNVTTTS
jgi:hypothetical protein